MTRELNKMCGKTELIDNIFIIWFKLHRFTKKRKKNSNKKKIQRIEENY